VHTLLHVGCGRQSLEILPPFDFETKWRQIRVDIDPSVNPDIVASITDLSPIEDASATCVFSKHNIEHLEHHEVPLALAAFCRVLKPEGFLILRCPDLEAVAQIIVEKKDPEKILYVASILDGKKQVPVAPIDILYGARTEIAGGNPFMAHRTAFTATSLHNKVKTAGFEAVKVTRHTELLELRCLALKRREGNFYYQL